MITITEKAVAAVKKLSDAEGIGHYTIRCKIKGGGCSGYQRDLFFEDDQFITDADEITEVDGIKIVIDELSMQYLDGTEIDFVDDVFSSGFRFNSPLVKSSCGCGSSVAF